MDNCCAHRTYRLYGLDRVLYSQSPDWSEGTFEQAETKWGDLQLRSQALVTKAEVVLALEAMDRSAEQFRIAVSLRTGCPITMQVRSTTLPRFPGDPVGAVFDSLTLAATAESWVRPNAPPATIEQRPVEAARWVQTFAETRNFSDHPDECIKRYYLLIEELLPLFKDYFTPDDLKSAQQVKWVRDFVAHQACVSQALCEFVLKRLPDAALPGEPLRVRFDRTQLEHRNFVGRFDPAARQLVSKLISLAMSHIESAPKDSAKGAKGDGGG